MIRDKQSGADDELSATGGQVVPLLEEELHVEKREVSTGKVRIHSVVEAFEETARATLEGEQVEITRVPVDRVVESAPSIRTEGDLTVVPVLEEVLFVEKRLVLKEELHIRRYATTETVEMPVTLRRERAVVERVDAKADVNTNEENLDGL